MLTALATIVSRVKQWLDGWVSDDPYYDWADQSLDGLTTDTFEEWMEKRNGMAKGN